MKVCCICKKETNEPYLHNAEPYAKGECCCRCNAEYVIPARLRGISIVNLDKLKSTHLYQTNGINQACQEDKDFCVEVIIAVSKYLLADWGDTCTHDKKLNDTALRTGNDRIVAKYITSMGDIFIINEIDRTITTILFAYEY